MENDMKRNEKYQFNSRLISSAHLNFFFGAGVNGRAICQMKDLKETVMIPGRAFVHDHKAEEVLSRDGVDRIVARGPDKLSVDGEMSGTLSREDVLKTELIAFQDLIEAINFFGVRK